jgi:hypothetical protein
MPKTDHARCTYNDAPFATDCRSAPLQGLGISLKLNLLPIAGQDIVIHRVRTTTAADQIDGIPL